jgi:hypothetical protein
MAKTKKMVKVFFPNALQLFSNFKVYLWFLKKGKEIKTRTKKRNGIEGKVCSLSVGREYRVVGSNGPHKFNSGFFIVQEYGIEVDEKQPPPIVPILLMGS